jgi:hypothetical protein
VYFLGSEFRNTGRVSQVLTRGYSQAVGWRGEVGVPRGRWLVEAGGAAERLRASQTLRTFATSADDTLRTLDERETGPALWSGAAWVEASRTGATGTVALGLRRGARSDVARGTWSPWIVAERRAGRLTVRAGAAGSAQFTDPLTALAARERPSAERASSYDVGVVQTISPTIEWAVTAFARREGDVLRSVGEDRLDATTGEFVGALPFPASSAVLEGRVRGADVVLRRRAASGLTGWASYTWAHARARDVATGERFDADFDQRHTLNVVASQRLSYRSTIGLTFRAGSNVPLAGYFEPAGDGLRLSHARNRVRLPTYARLDARLTRTFTFARHRMTLFVEVMNVLNRRNVGPADASVRRSLEVTGFAERLIPRVPSAGLLVEF